VVDGGAASMLSNQLVHVKHAIHRMDVRFTSLSRERSSHGVLVTFVTSPARDKVVSVWGPNEVDSATS
jgi:hypothetical protein